MDVNTLMRVIRVAGRVCLAVLAIGVATLVLARDSRSVGASHTEILASYSSSTPTAVQAIVLMAGGTPGGANPCEPAEADPTTACLYLWAKNVDNSSGVSAFRVTGTYASNLLDVTSIIGSTVWLGSTGRSASCPGLVLDPGLAHIDCVSIPAPPPFGPNCANNHCNGLLGWMTFESGASAGTTTINLSEDTNLIDTPVNPPDRTAIPVTIRSVIVIVAPCADYNSDQTVRVGDILYIVGRYRNSAPEADLNGDGDVLVDDILIGVAQYFIDCP